MYIMEAALRLFSFITVALYVVSAATKETFGGEYFHVADAIAAITLVWTLLTQKKKLLPALALAWLALNYYSRLPDTNRTWYAYDGFVIGQLLCRLGF